MFGRHDARPRWPNLTITHLASRLRSSSTNKREDAMKLLYKTAS
jgi:hypothetical protein